MPGRRCLHCAQICHLCICSNWLPMTCAGRSRVQGRGPRLPAIPTRQLLPRRRLTIRCRAQTAPDPNRRRSCARSALPVAIDRLTINVSFAFPGTAGLGAALLATVEHSPDSGRRWVQLGQADGRPAQPADQRDRAGCGRHVLYRRSQLGERLTRPPDRRIVAYLAGDCCVADRRVRRVWVTAADTANSTAPYGPATHSGQG
jgi:hypothetical protein